MNEKTGAPIQDTLLREIEDDLRRDRMQKLWKRHRKLLVAAISLVFIAVAAYQFWTRFERQRQEETSARYVQAMGMIETDPSAALAEFQELARDAPAGYALKSRFQEAALLAQKGDAAAAIDIYRRLASDGALPVYRDLAILKAATLALAVPSAGMGIGEIRSHLERLAADSSGYRFSARELLAVAALQENRDAEARQILIALSENADAPSGIRERARMIASQIPVP